MSSSKPLKSKDHTSSHTLKSPKSSKKNQNPPKSSKTKKPSSSASQPPNPPQSPEKPKPSSSPRPQNPKKLEASPSPPPNPPKSQKEPKPSPRSNMSKDPDASANDKGSGAAAAAALLRAAAEFRSRTGASPTASTVGLFFEFFKDSLTPLGITEGQIRNKIRHLRHKFNQAASKGDQDTPFYKLSLEAWGAPGDKSTTPHRSLLENNNLMDEDDYEQDEEDDDEDVGDFVVLYPIMTQQLSDYWKKNDLSETLLEEKLKSIDPKKAREVEKRLVKHFDDGLKLREMQQNLNNEVCKLMRDACRLMSS